MVNEMDAFEEDIRTLKAMGRDLATGIRAVIQTVKDDLRNERERQAAEDE